MLKKSQLKNKWDKLKADLGAWRKLMRKQTGTGWNWDKGTINMDAEWWKKTKNDIPGVGKFKNRPLQNEDEMNVMFGSIINEEIDHWNPMSSNPIIPPSGDAPLILAWTTMMKKMIWVLILTPTMVMRFWKSLLHLAMLRERLILFLKNLTRNTSLPLHLLYKNIFPRYQRVLSLLCLLGKQGSPLNKSWNMSLHVGLTLGVMSILWQVSCL